ncbi:hypothetical protein T11_1870 [Trichinella zimbabwensis]|uniref:Uncharacterized protein n=1 Tax=Trichinella zimbabwensis TaxID=268475 RepID=A0A0V1HSX9_9BILA|nr:hypothetical protein T11_1870 [Trichinella zimbabwensis]
MRYVASCSGTMSVMFEFIPSTVSKCTWKPVLTQDIENITTDNSAANYVQRISESDAELFPKSTYQQIFISAHYMKVPTRRTPSMAPLNR